MQGHEVVVYRVCRHWDIKGKLLSLSEEDTEDLDVLQQGIRISGSADIELYKPMLSSASHEVIGFMPYKSATLTYKLDTI